MKLISKYCFTLLILSYYQVGHTDVTNSSPQPLYQDSAKCTSQEQNNPTLTEVIENLSNNSERIIRKVATQIAKEKVVQTCRKKSKENSDIVFRKNGKLFFNYFANGAGLSGVVDGECRNKFLFNMRVNHLVELILNEALALERKRARASELVEAVARELERAGKRKKNDSLRQDETKMYSCWRKGKYPDYVPMEDYEYYAKTLGYKCKLKN